MAKQIEDIIVKLGLQGFEGLDKIRSSFRDLSKVTQMSDKDITSARDALFDFAKTAGNTEAVNKGLISAFQGLRTQADICGKAYQELSRDLQRLSEVQRGATDTLMAQRQAVLASTAAGTQNVTALQQQRAALIALRAQTRDSSAAFIQFSTDIQAVETRLTNLATVNSRLNSALSRARAGTSAGARAELVAIDNGIAALRQEIDAIDLLNSKTRALAATQQQRLAIEERVNTALAARRQLQFQEATRTAREAVRTGAETFNSRDLTQGPLSAQNISQRLGDLPNTTAGLSQELSELNERLINTYRNTETYIEVQLRLAAVQRELTSATQGYGAALLADLNAGTLIPSQKNLAEVIGQLRREMLELDQTTTEGSRAYAQNANQVRLLEQQLNQLANAYGNVADKARTAAAQGTNPFTPSGARNPAYVREQLAALEVALGTVDASNLDAVDALLNAKRTLYEYEAQVSAQLDQQKEQLAAQELARVDAQDKKEDAAFKRELNRLDILKQQTAAAREALGFDTQRELSPLYRQITGMATAGVARQQQFMGRSPSQVLNDIASSFNAGGRGVDLKQRSTEIGGSVAEGVAQGAADSAATATGAKNFADKLITAYKQAFRIKSPSGKSKDEIGIPIGQGIGLGIIEGIKSLRARVQLAIKDVTATPGRAALPVGGGPVSDVADRLQSFLARTSAKTSTFLPLTRLMGEGVTGSAALPLAVYRRSYERGGIVAPSFLPVEQRRGLRGTPGIPGAGLEEIIRAEAFRAVSRTGAFVGPLSGPQTAGGAASSAYRAGISPGTFQRPFTAGVSQPLFAAATQLAPLQRTLPGMAYRMGGSQFAFPADGPLGGGRSLTFGRSGANASVTQSIRTYRKAVDNFWAEETESFEAIRRVLSSDVQLSASKLARNLTETRNTTAALTTAAVQLVSVPGAAFTKLGAAVRGELSEIKEAVASAGQDLTSGAQRVRQSVAGAGGAVRNAVSPLLGGRFGGAVPPGSGGGGGASPEANNEFTKLNATLTQFGALSRRSVTDIRDLGSVLDELRNNLSPLDAEYKQVNKRIEAQQVLIERELGRRERRASRRLSGMQLAQGVGAALSGGIFGGPEGLIGGLGGLAVGGVGGAFAGAAAGAQVGMFRQQLAGVTDYSASIDKLQIALRGIVGSQAAYTQALAAAASVTRDLNIPQETAIQGMTRLSAAVQGAGGTVSDSAFAFRAVSEAVKATGGNAEQADGALLALTQVFSKGKVSAEELNQIAERLPGTFTLFAKAAGKSGPELQKALQQGEVGLNDLMKFLQLISGEYGQTALKIAASSQEAGARLSVAMKNMQLEVGRALQPIGASLQSAFADFITKVTPAVVTALKGIAAAFEFLVENKTASGLATFALQLGAVTAGLVALRSAMAAVSAMNLTALFTSTAASAKVTGDVLTTTATNAGGLTGKLTNLRTSVGLLAKSFAAPIVLTVAVVGAELVIRYFNRIKDARDSLLKTINAPTGSQWLSDIGGMALDKQKLTKAVDDVGKEYQKAADSVIKYQKQVDVLTKKAPTMLGSPAIAVAAQLKTAESELKLAKAQEALLASRYRAGVARLPYAPEAAGISRFPTAPSDDKDKKKAKEATDTAAAEQQRLANTLLDQQLRAADRVFQHQIELDRQRYELQKRLDDMQAQNRILRETGSARDIVSNFEELQRSLRDIEERRLTAAQNVRLAQQAQQSAAVRATFADQGAARLTGATGFIAKTGSTGDSTGPHLDARWADGRRITAQDADRYLTVNGRSPSSFGVTSPYGPRRLFGRSFHAGIDFGTPSGSTIGLKSGANLLRDLGFTGAGGYAVEIDTPEGKMRLLHLQAGSAKLPTGAAAQQNRAIKAGGGAVIETADLNQAKAQQKLIEDRAAEERAALFEQFTLKATASLREQNATMRDNNELQTLRNRLTMEGVSPERIDLEERLLGVSQEQNRAQDTYNKLIEENKNNPANIAQLNSELAAQNEQFAERVRLLRESADAAETFNRAMRTRQDDRIGLGLREGAEQYVQSIGTMREATSQLAQTGIKGVEDAIFSLVTTGTANFKEFAASILKDTARMIIQQMILRSVMQIIGAIGGGAPSGLGKGYFDPITGKGAAGPNFGFAKGAAFAANGIVPFAMGGLVDKPTLFKFANGGAGRLGLMGEAGPEAIMPLRRLPSGRLGVEAAGGSNSAPITVNVSVDANGTSVQGDAGQGEQLGRVISQAVQAELVRQKRPGGLLSR